MPSHRITLSLPTTDVLNTDVTLNVWSDDELLGELKVSRGSIDWRPGRHQYTCRLSWEQFDQLMQEHGARI